MTLFILVIVYWFIKGSISNDCYITQDSKKIIIKSREQEKNMEGTSMPVSEAVPVSVLRLGDRRHLLCWVL
jgi:hypothetical protein